MESEDDVLSALWDFDNPESRETVKPQKKITNQNVSDSEECQLLPPSENKSKRKMKEKQLETRELTQQEVLQQEYLYLAELEKNLATLVKSKEDLEAKKLTKEKKREEKRLRKRESKEKKKAFT